MAHTALLPNSSFILKPARQVLAGMLRRDTVQFGLKPLLRRLPELSGPPWGARGELSVVTDPACASAWTCGPRGSARPSEPLRRDRARPRSRQRGRWLRCPDRPEPVGATAQIDRPSGATWVL